jgi:hypothetical protein
MAERHETALDLYAIHAKRINFDMMVDRTFPTVDGVPISTGEWDSVQFKFAAGVFASGAAAFPTPIPFIATIPAPPPSWASLDPLFPTRINFHERGVYIVNINQNVAAGVDFDVAVHYTMSNGALPYQSTTVHCPGFMTNVNQATSVNWVINYPGDGNYYTEIAAKAENWPSFIPPAPTYDGFGEILIHHQKAPPQ